MTLTNAIYLTTGRVKKVFAISLLYTLQQLVSQPLGNGYSKFIGNVYGNSAPAAHWDNYWNQVTPENASKWEYFEPSRGVYSPGGVDAIYNFAKQRGIPFKFHTIFWGQQYPGWALQVHPDTLAKSVEERIKYIAERYPDMESIDVVNEPLSSFNDANPSKLRSALGGAGTTGWDYVIKVFEWARQYFPPHVKLILNDYNIINDNNRTTTLLQIVNLLKARGLIDVIGVQAHRFEVETQSISVMKNNLDRLAATGLPIYISEFDIGNLSNAGTPNDNFQLAKYKEVFPMLWEHPGVKGITFWGYVEGQMWQSTAYLLRSNGTERPALVWLRDYLTKGQYRTAQSGNWNNVTTWQKRNDSMWVAATSVPTLSDNAITILNGHTVTVTADDSIGQLIVAAGGVLQIDSAVSFKIKNEQGTDLLAQGTVINKGTILAEDSSLIKFANGGKYIHAQSAGSIPAATWADGSICEITGYTSGSKPGNLNQNFFNFIWNCPGQTANVDWGWFENVIGGTVTVKNTGTSQARMTSPSAGTPNTITINGGINVEGGQFTSNGSGSAAEITINTYGAVNVTGGNFSVARGSGPTVKWNLFNNFSMSNAVTQNSNPGGATFVFKGNGIRNLSLGAGNTITALPIEVAPGTTLDLGTSALTGSGNFTIDSGATLALSHSGGLDSAILVSGTISLSKQGNYAYNGTAAQATGSLLPDTVGNLILNNNAGVTLSDTVTVKGTLEIQKGALSLGGNIFFYGPESSLKYSNTTAQTTTDVEFPAENGPKNLVISNLNGVTLHASRTINGKLELGGKLTLGSNIFTAHTATSTGTSRYVLTGANGALKLTGIGTGADVLFPVGTNFYAPVWVKNNGTTDTIAVSVETDTTSAPYGGRVRVKWNIQESTPGGGDYTLTFGWLTTLENTAFRNPNRNHNAHIFSLKDTTVAGSGDYTLQFTTQPYTSSRGGITELGAFAVGRFKDVPDILDVERIEHELPLEFSLRQNYPNPFNPATTIKYSLPTASPVKLTIYNLLGARIRTLVNEHQPAGGYSVVWNARDNHNTQVASGVYFYRLEAGSFVSQKKMILLK